MRDGLSTRLVWFGPVFVIVLWRVLWGTHLQTWDFYPSYLASELWAAGQSQAVYPTIVPDSAEALTCVSAPWAEALERHGVDHMSCFLYHPYYLLLMFPVVKLLSLQAATVALYWLNAACAFGIAYGSLYYAGVKPSLRFPLGVLIAGAGAFAVAASYGQNILVGVALGMLGLGLAERGRDGPALVVLLLTSLFKPWLVLLLAVFWIFGRLRTTLVGLGAYATVFVVVPRLLMPSLTAAYRDVLTVTSNHVLLCPMNLSLHAIVQRARSGLSVPDICRWTPMHPGLLVATTMVLGALFLLLLWRMRTRSRPEAVVMLLAATLVPLSLVWWHYLVAGLPLVVFALVRGNNSSRAFVLGTVLFLANPWVAMGSGDWPGELRFVWSALGMVGLTLALLALSFGSVRSDATERSAGQDGPT